MRSLSCHKYEETQLQSYSVHLGNNPKSTGEIGISRSKIRNQWRWEKPALSSLREQSCDKKDEINFTSKQSVKIVASSSMRAIRRDLNEIWDSFSELIKHEKVHKTSIALPLKVFMAICRRLVDSPLHTLFGDSKMHSKIVECFESAVNDISSSFALPSSQSDTSGIMEEIPKAIMWNIKRLKLALARVSRYLILSGESEADEAEKVSSAKKSKFGESEEAERASTMDLVDKIGLDLEAKSMNTERGDQSTIALSNTILDAYIECLHSQVDDSLKKGFIKKLSNNELIKLFLVKLQLKKEREKEYFQLLAEDIKMFKAELDRSNNAHELICRICEKTVRLDKYIIHTDLCQKRAECKKKFIHNDELLLDYGEELTTKIKSLSKALYC